MDEDFQPNYAELIEVIRHRDPALLEVAVLTVQNDKMKAWISDRVAETKDIDDE